MKRRDFMKGVLVGAGVALGERYWVRDASGAPVRSPTERVSLGKTGIKASLLGMGTGVHGWMRTSDHTRMGPEAFNTLIRYGYDKGINFFDCADLYGTHTMLRDALKGIPREKYVIQSKIWWRSEGLPEQVKDATAAIDRFRKELDTDYIDSVLLHCTDARSWTTDLRPMMDQMEEARQKGIIKAHGTSCHSMDALKASAESPWVNVQLARVNNRGPFMDGKPEEIAAHLKGMRAAGKAVIAMKVFGEGTFRTPELREASLRWLLAQQCVDMMIIGFEKRSELDETLGQMEGILREQP